MRITAIPPHAISATAFPRGWIVLGSALASWLALATIWFAVSSVFQFIAAAL